MKRFSIIAAAFAILLAACSSTAGPTTGPTSRSNAFRHAGTAASFSLQPFGECDALLSWIKGHALERVGPWGLEGSGGGGHLEGDVVLDEFQGAPATTVASFSAEPGAARDSVAFSTTNVQEIGVDEPDIVKTDGTRIFALAQGKLHLVEVTKDGPVLRDSLRIEDGWAFDLLLAGDRVVVMSTLNQYGGGPVPLFDVGHGYGYGGNITRLTEIDVSDPADLTVVGELLLDGRYLSARMVGDVARIVVTSQPTGLEFTYPETNGLRRQREAERKNRQVIEDSTLENWVPYFVLDKDGEVTEGPLLDCGDVAHPAEYAGLGMLTVITVDLSEGIAPGSGFGIFSNGETIYASPDNLYVATQRWFDQFEDPADAGLTTSIHQFDISDPESTAYVASGVVPGYLLSQWAMSEFDGVLRVASTSRPTWWGGGEQSESFMTTLRADDGELKQLGQVGNLGKGEQIYSVRYIGDTGYVVTFRETDPLYTLDLSDPANPEVVGELKILGYSAYLHPVGDGLLLGIGQDATEQGRRRGAQVSLFDVSDLANPTRLHQFNLDKDSSSEVEYDHRAFLYWQGTALVPMTRWGWDEATQTEDYFSGSLALSVDRELGIAQRGVVTHTGDDQSEWWDGNYQIRRSVVIGDTLYTLSEMGLKASDLDTFDDLAWVKF